MMFSFIIVNFRSVGTLSICLTSLATAGLAPDEYEVIVVNNDPSERETLEQLRAHHTFTLIHTPHNLGFGSACNRGAKEASGDILGFINPDAALASGALHNIATVFHNDASIGIVGARLIDVENQTEAWSLGSFPTLWRLIHNNLGSLKDAVFWQSKASSLQKVDWVSGAALFISNKLFTKLNGFDERFFLYFEDVDLCIRAKALGKSTLSFPEVVFHHESGASSPSKSLQKQHFYTSQDHYFSLHRPHWEEMVVKVLRKIFSTIL